MKKTIEAVGKKVDNAIEEGLRSLTLELKKQVSQDDVDVKIISTGGLFKKAKVELTIEIDEPVSLTPKESPAAKKEKEKPLEKEKPQKLQKDFKNQPPKNESKTVVLEEKQKEQKFSASKNANTQNAEHKKTDNSDKKRYEKKPREKVDVAPEHTEKCAKFIDGLLANMGVEGKAALSVDDGIRVEIETADSTVIGRRGETLDAIQYLAGIVLGENNGKYIPVSVDALGYRAARNETLKQLAAKMAEKCLRNGRKVVLDPMSSAERRVIHAALQDNEQIITRSEGHDPNRKIVILPKRVDRSTQ